MDTIYENEKENEINDKEDDENEKIINILLTCPNCNDFVLIEKLNCRIFRHGVFKMSGKQVYQHSTKEQCEIYITKNLIYGCGKPFNVIKDVSGNFTTEICDYL